MKKLLRSVIGTAAGLASLIGLGACDADPPPPPEASVSQLSEPLAARETPAVKAVVDPEIRKALGDAARDPDPFSRARRLSTLLPTLGPEAAPAIAETLGDLTLDLGATELQLLVAAWATHQPQEASIWARTRSSPFYRVGAIVSALTTWAEQDPLAAAALADRWLSEDPTLGTSVPIALIRGWFKAGDSPELKQYIYDLGPGFVQLRAIATYVRAAIQDGGQEGLKRWAESLPEEDSRYKLAVYRQVASALPLFDHEAAIRWCEAHCEGPFGMDMRSQISRRWVLVDGPGALRWLSTAPKGDETDLAVRITYALWGRSQRAAALGWMADQAAGELAPWMTPMLSVYALFVSEDAPREAIQWSERIEDAEDRAKVQVLVARKWRESDPAAAESWIEQSSLSEDDRTAARRSRPGAATRQ